MSKTEKEKYINTIANLKKQVENQAKKIREYEEIIDGGFQHKAMSYCMICGVIYEYLKVGNIETAKEIISRYLTSEFDVLNLVHDERIYKEPVIKSVVTQIYNNFNKSKLERKMFREELRVKNPKELSGIVFSEEKNSPLK
jgi:hypothetical protein